MLGFDASEEGWATYPDERIDGVGAVSGIRSIGAFGYAPDLGPVGSGSAGTYYPRDTAGDGAALNYLGFYPDPYLADHVGTTGSQKGDMNAQAGAWDPTFQQAVKDFQDASGLVPDGWIGPSTRSALAAAVTVKNGRELPGLPGSIVIPGAPGGGAPGLRPASATTGGEDNTLLYVGLGAAGLALAGLAYALLSD